MDSIIIAAIIGAGATIVAALIVFFATRKPKAKSGPSKLNSDKAQNISIEMGIAFRLGIGVFGLVTSALNESEKFNKAIEAGHKGIERIFTKLFSPQRFPELHSLMRNSLTSGDFQTANSLHEAITNAVFDSYPPAVQIAYVFGAYIPILTGFDSYRNKMEAPLAITLNALKPLHRIVHNTSDLLPKEIVKSYDNILAKRKVSSSASRITDWFMELT